MTKQPQVFVNGKPFFGRVEEQRRFRAALQEILQQPKDETLPYIFLLYGDGGIGKTTLARRFRDIANEEPPFEKEFQVLWVDWEDERKRFPALQVGRDLISPETVFDVIYTVAQRNGWKKHFKSYRKALDERKNAEKKAAEVITPSDERDELAALRGAGAIALAKFIRLKLPAIGKGGEELSKTLLEAGIQVGAEQAYALRMAAENRLRARLGINQFDLFINPNESIARALADGLKRLASKQPLIVVMDTYEIVDRADIWLRMVMQAAEKNLIWIISGRNNLLKSRQYDNEYFKGYSEEFSTRLVDYDLRQLALDDVKAYFAAYVPGRALDEDTAEAIRRVTHGIPLAVEEAAEMWGKDFSLEVIVGDNTEAIPGKQIVARMTQRYFLHVVEPNENDRYALYALVLANGDLELLRAMLHPEEETELVLRDLLQRLERDYASVHAGEYRLHDEPAAFILAHLKEPLQRASKKLRVLLEKAEETLHTCLGKHEKDLPLIEECCMDEDWLKDVLVLTNFLFWVEEEKAWHWLMLRFIEGIAYSRELRRGLLQIAISWEKDLSQRGKKRMKTLQIIEEPNPTHDDLQALIRELERSASQGLLEGEGEAERRAILALQRGHWLARQKRYTESLAAYESVERNMPAKGKRLQEQLGEALDNLASKLMWPEGSTDAEYNPDAMRILKKVTIWLPEKGGTWYRMGVAYAKQNLYTDAITVFKKAIELDPKDASPWHGLGNIYASQNKTEDAIQAYKKAIELDPKNASPWHGLGIVYEDLDRHDEAIEAYQKAIEMEPNFASPYNNLAGIYMERGEFDKAHHYFNERIRLGPKTALNAFVSLGIIARYHGEDDSDIYFNQALEIWDNAWKAHLQSPAGLLENKALALLCLGQYEQGLEALRHAIEQRLLSDTIEYYSYEFLSTAPNPPEGIEEAIAMLKEAENQ